MPFLGQKKGIALEYFFFKGFFFYAPLSRLFFFWEALFLARAIFCTYLTKFRHFADLRLIFCHFLLQKKQLPLLALVLFLGIGTTTARTGSPLRTGTAVVNRFLSFFCKKLRILSNKYLIFQTFGGLLGIFELKTQK